MPEAEAGPRASRDVFRGKLVSLAVEAWPGGDREVVHHPGACAVVAVTPGGEVLLVRQFREPVRQTLLEIPAGIFDVQGEGAMDCAVRELLEETGHRAETLEPLATLLTSPGFADERIEVFLARASEDPVAGTAEPGLEVVRLPLEEAVKAIASGAITDAKTVAGLLLARDRGALAGRG